MKCEYKVFVDGERKPLKAGKGIAEDVVKQYVLEHKRGIVLRKLADGEKVDYTNRRHGVRIVLTHATKRANVKRERSGFIRIKLDGVKTETQIRVAAANKLKLTTDGWHRRVCLVEANGIEYKVKCMHKGMTYTEAVYRSEIVGKKVL